MNGRRFWWLCFCFFILVPVSFAQRPEPLISTKVSTTVAKTPAITHPPAQILSLWETTLLDEINLVRTNPEKAVALLEEYRKFYQGKEFKYPNSPIIDTVEGVAALEEAIKVIKNTQPLPPLQISQALTLAAKDHLSDMLTKNISGHQGSDGSLPTQRVNRYGVLTEVVGENISYFIEEARIVFLWMLIDDGNKRRGHRNNIFSSRFGFLGIASGQSKETGRICIITFADQNAPPPTKPKPQPVKLN